VRQGGRPVEEADRSGQDPPDPLPLRTAGDRPPGPASWLAAPAVAILAVVCCAGPLLLAAVAASGGGAWLAAHGYTLGAAALIVIAALLAWMIRTRMSRG
jgi:hypothetical protein